MRTFFLIGLCVLLNAYLYAADSFLTNDDAPIITPKEEPTASRANQQSNSTPTPLPKVYKWVDDKGLTHYGDQPPSGDVTPVALPPLEIIDNTTLGGDPALTTSPETAVDNTAMPTGSVAGNEPIHSVDYQLNITAPKNDETVMRNQEGTVFVALSVNMPLLTNHRISMVVDGNEIAIDNSGALNISVEQGNHTVQASIVDENNNVLVHSNMVAFKVIDERWLKQQPMHTTRLPAIPPIYITPTAPPMKIPSPTTPKPARSFTSG